MIHDCDNCKHAETPVFFEPCASCGGSSCWEPEVKTNYDRIVSKTPEELAKELVVLSDRCPDGVDCESVPHGRKCFECWLDWLKQEAQA